MDIILDANIIRRDLKLNDKNYEILLDYLKKTNSRLILPSIVVEEIKGLYKRAIKERIEEFNKSTQKLKSTLMTQDKLSEMTLDADNETKLYIDFIFDKLNIKDTDIINYDNSFLPELVKRAIERRKPLDNKGQQFRDGLLWLTLLDYAQKTEDKRVIFISDNPTDFADKGENRLNNDLLKETSEKGLEIKYFRRLSDFAKEQASTIEFITEKWIEEKISKDTIEELFQKEIDNIGDDEILGGVELESNEKITGHLNQTGSLTSALMDYYVYEKTDGQILINAEWEIGTEFEYEVEREIERETSRFKHRYYTNPMTGEPELDMEYIPDYSVDYEYDYKYDLPLFRVMFAITVENGEVKSYDLKEWNWG